MSFAVPIKLAEEIARQIISQGSVHRAWIGITGHAVNPRLARYYGLSVYNGVFVAEVAHSSPAESAGIKIGDTIVSVAGKPMASVNDLLKVLSQKSIGEAIELEVVRNGAKRLVSVALGTRPF